MKVLISAGPTREAIDAVRFISNRSTGKMGYALAAAAVERGWEVVLVSGPVTLPSPVGVEMVPVESAAEMAREIRARAPEAGLVVMAAAVADYRPVRRIAGKMKKSAGPLVLELERTEDILAGLGAAKPAEQILVGFAAETDDIEANALGKLERKNLDWIAANDVGRSDAGFGADTNCVVLYGRGGERIEIGLAGKLEVARRILDAVTRPQK